MIVGKLGVAEPLPLVPRPDRPADKLTLGHYLLTMEYSHPAYLQHWLSIITLDGIPGVVEPLKGAPNMTHELMFWAVNPARTMTETDLERFKTGEDPTPFLAGKTFGVQLELDSDEEAVEYLGRVATSLVDGFLPVFPDECGTVLALWHNRLRKHLTDLQQERGK